MGEFNNRRWIALLIAALLIPMAACSSGTSGIKSPSGAQVTSVTAKPSTATAPPSPGASTATSASAASESTPGGTGSDLWLSDFTAAQNILTNTWGDAERINGTEYVHTVVIQQSSGVTDPIGGSWDLARHCSTLSFKAAGPIDTASDPGARLVFAVSADGTERWHREIDFGSSAAVTSLDISNALRLTLTTTDVGDLATRAEGGFGDIVVRCSAEPPNPKQ